MRAFRLRFLSYHSSLRLIIMFGLILPFIIFIIQGLLGVDGTGICGTL